MDFIDELLVRVERGERSERRRLLLTALHQIRPLLADGEGTSPTALRASLPAIRDRWVARGARESTVLTYLSRIRAALDEAEGLGPRSRGALDPRWVRGPAQLPTYLPTTPSGLGDATSDTTWEHELEAAFEHAARWPRLRRYLLPVLLELSEKGDVGPDKVDALTRRREP